MSNAIEAEAARVKADGAFSRSPSLLTLFDYLVGHAEAPQAPKDVEIAYRIFGDNAQNAGTDAQVRVLVHRLRGKLKEYYSENGAGPFGSLSIPKGEYRLVLNPRVGGDAKVSKIRILGASILISSILCLFFIYSFGNLIKGSGSAEIPDVWKYYINSSSSIMILVGDKVACTVPGKVVRQENAIANGCDKSVDNAHIIPEGIAGSMHFIDSVLVNRESGTRFRIVMASEAIPEMMRKTNVVYIGLLEDLGIMGQPLSDISRFAKNWKANTIDISGEKTIANGRGEFDSKDKGYIASFPSADGNRVIIAAGTSNAGLLQATETLANPPAMKELEQAAHGRDFEAVFQVNSINQTNMGARLLAIRPFANAQTPGAM